MGNCCLPIQFRRTPSAVNPKSVTLLLLGLDNAGKTTIVRRLAGEPIDSVVPTVGFSVILLRQRGCHVSVYDLGGGPQIRDIWPRYYADAHGIIFVTDSRDIDRMEECRQVLEKLLRNDQISGKPVLLLANKQDLEGSLDEIDIVDRLNLERIVNEQKCPTLVELCSALNFSKRIDIGIENGYKWLIRSIIREYPSLNNRVLADLTKQEEENKVHAFKRVKREEEGNEEISNHVDGNPFKPIMQILEDEVHSNGYIKTRRRSNSGIKTVATIPGLVDEGPQKNMKTTRQVQQVFGEQEKSSGLSRAESAANSYSSEFFLLNKFQSDLELLNEVPNHAFKNFLVRPKSSGARLYGVRPERKKQTHKRKRLKKGNKTGPSPFTDISNELVPQFSKNSVPRQNSFEGDKSGIGDSHKIRSKNSVENVNPFTRNLQESQGEEHYEMTEMGMSKSVPNSRKNSVTKKRRHSMANGRVVGSDKLSSVNTKEILLDVTKLGSVMLYNRGGQKVNRH